MKNIAIFASGGGSNAIKIIEHLQAIDKLNVACIVCNNPNAGIIDKAKKRNIKVHLGTKSTIIEEIVPILINENIDYIVLAGYLLLIPDALIKAYPNKIINIHPALLPKFGGKGMYGVNVHTAVLEAEEKESGITIHYVNERFDDGEIIFQASCPTKPNDTPELLAARVLKLEHKHYPKIIAQLWNN